MLKLNTLPFLFILLFIEHMVDVHVDFRILGGLRLAAEYASDISLVFVVLATVQENLVCVTLLIDLFPSLADSLLNRADSRIGFFR